MKVDKKTAIRIITKAARDYDDRLNRKQFLIIYKNGNGNEYVEIGFRDMNFLHLTGVKSHLSAQRFYERCLNSKLAEDDIEIDKNGKVQQKLKVLPFLHELLYHSCMIGDYVNSGVMISADYFVGDTKLVLSVGFRKGALKDYPVTLYSGDIRKLTNPTNKVLAIYVKTFPENIYREMAFAAKDVVLSDLEVPKEYLTFNKYNKST